jgi:hypothetical protein
VAAASNADLFDRVLSYQDDLVGLFTGGSLDNAAYGAMRNDLLKNAAFGGLGPKFLNRFRDTGSLWSFAKSVDPSWEPRRRFVREQFEPLLDYLEKAPRPIPASMPATYDANAWTGVEGSVQQAVAVRTLIPLAQSAVEELISHLEEPSHNGGPPLDEIADAVTHLRQLHASLGRILQTLDDGKLASVLGEGLMAEAARYGKRAAKALRNDPMPYALSAMVLATLTACGFPGLGGYLSGMALAIKRPDPSTG